MGKDRVLDLLLNADSYLSGESMSRELSVSRTAIWKAIASLRTQGYEIEAKTNLGYRLLWTPDTPTKDAVLAHVQGREFCSEVVFLDEIDSTNTHLKHLAAKGARHATVCIANSQTDGRGRRGRSFVSSEQKGLFFSILLRPDKGMQAENLTRITAFSALAVCDALSKTVDVQAQIKWVNDILVDGKKIVGILSEMSVLGECGQVDYIVVGVGINVHYKQEDFPPEIKDTASSLAILTGKRIDRAKLAANLIDAFDVMYQQMQGDTTALVARYRTLSATIGCEIDVITADEKKPAFAKNIDENCALLVVYEDGREDTLHYGEISIRGKN